MLGIPNIAPPPAAAKSAIKSIQRGTGLMPEYTNSLTVTITWIDLTKAFLLFSFDSSSYWAGTSAGQAIDATMIKGKITNATTLDFSKNGTNQTGYTTTVYWQVVEYV